MLELLDPGIVLMGVLVKKDFGFLLFLIFVVRFVSTTSLPVYFKVSDYNNIPNTKITTKKEKKFGFIHIIGISEKYRNLLVWIDIFKQNKKKHVATVNKNLIQFWKWTFWTSFGWSTYNNSVIFTNIPVPINSAKRALRVPILSFFTSSKPT